MNNQERVIAGSDRISRLPDCILQLILVLLPLQEAVRTSILSRTWRYLYTQIPNLVFENSFFQSIGDKRSLLPIIHEIIRRNRGPLHDFTFSLTGVSSDDIGLPVHRWAYAGADYFELEDELYKLLSRDELQSLKRLHLETCLCTFPDNLRDFRMLTKLSLYEVDIDGEDLSYLVSKCPLLNILTLVNLPLCHYLYLDAPNLRVFFCQVYLLGLSFDCTPRLEKMFVCLDDTHSDEPEDIVVPFGGIPSIKHMELNGCFLKYMNRCEQKIARCRDALNHLMFIKLTDVSFEEIEVGQSVLSLIRRAPNLEAIRISASSWQAYLEPAVGLWPIGDLPDVSLNGLRRVYIENITGKQSEVEFIGMLLANSPMLEAMDILLHYELTVEEGVKIAEEIGHFHHASSQLSVKFGIATSEN